MQPNKSVEEIPKYYSGGRALAKNEVVVTYKDHLKALTSHTNTVLQGVVERVEEMNEQNQVTQGILSAMEYRGFYDAGKYLDGDIWKIIKPEIISLLNDQIISNEEKK